MLTESEWTTVYDHLVARLRDAGLAKIAAEVEAAAVERVVEEYRPDDPSRFSRAELIEQSETVSRARMPSEAWQAALMVLHTYLIEVPEIARRAADLLDRDPGQIEFRADAREDEMRGVSEPFRLADLMIRSPEREPISREIEALLRTSRMRADARSDAE